MNSLSFPQFSALLLGILFVATAAYRQEHRVYAAKHTTPEGEVVIAAPVQVLLFGGDRFLAANFEAIRAATLGFDGGKERVEYRIRSHQTISELNPCHEDNYYMGNAVLTWGGMAAQGNDLLKQATECRFWDSTPPFMYGFNQYFFYKNISAAQTYLEISARRSPTNAAALRKLSIMIGLKQIDDTKMARNYLSDQVKRATDNKLKRMLQKRLTRLDGLIELRNAQQQYEKRFSRQLEDPQDLLTNGILQEWPADPLGLGYEFNNGQFDMRSYKIQGMEDYQ